MRRLLPTILVLLAGCARDQPETRKSLGERCGDYFFYCLNGGQTHEEIEAETARAQQQARDAEASYLRNQANSERYGSSY
jgi:hypothetical protein